MAKKKKKKRSVSTKRSSSGQDARLNRIEKSLETVAQQVAKNTTLISTGFDSVNGSLIVMEKNMSDLVAVLKEGHSPKLEKHEQSISDHEVRISDLEGSSGT